MQDQIQSTRLENGLKILTERMPGLRSATIGIWVRKGSRHEPRALNGISHFIEHAVFKGTLTRSAMDIAVLSDRLGGNLDAFTTHEMTGFSMKVADSAIRQAFDLLSDMLANPRFDQTDLEREQRVIIEEMKMVEDTPDEFLTELFTAAYFPGHPLGLPIEGTPETVSTFGHDLTARFHSQEFGPANLVVVAAGNIDHHEIVKMATAVFGTVSDSSTSGEDQLRPNAAAPILVEKKTELEQAHLIIAAPWPDAHSADRYAGSLLASVIGGGTSSRLWQSIREERGLAYTVGAGGNAFSDAGIFNIYAGTSPEHLDEVIDISLAAMRRVVRESVGADELKLVKDQAISSILLGLESSSVRAGALARQEIVHGRRISPDDIIARLEAVTSEDLLRIAQEYFRTEGMALGALGDLNGFSIDRSRLAI